MKIRPLELNGIQLIEFPVYHDNRGHFAEWYKASTYHALGIKAQFVQDNYSRSKPGVVRGLHYQFDKPQAKLVGVIRGSIIDIVVDVRSKSPTFGKSIQIQLDDRDRSLLWIPAGFAHGFAVIGEEPADVLYKTDAEYNPKGEGGIRWNDPELEIKWPISNPIVSDRDQNLPTFASYRAAPRF